MSTALAIVYGVDHHRAAGRVLLRACEQLGVQVCSLGGRVMSGLLVRWVEPDDKTIVKGRVEEKASQVSFPRAQNLPLGVGLISVGLAPPRSPFLRISPRKALCQARTEGSRVALHCVLEPRSLKDEYIAEARRIWYRAYFNGGQKTKPKGRTEQL